MLARCCPVYQVVLHTPSCFPNIVIAGLTLTRKALAVNGMFQVLWLCIGETWGVFTLGDTSVTPLAQAAVSVQNPPSGSQTCFPGGWVR